ncbi:CRISPR-associated endonuclease/helicase Cas3 [Algoriphagus ratkowskyi]|uniref:CRISPR-associated endonuclease/helicase Cas3 n=1 Tax=Algoriphagus ratkowskyi TaxID=57028 RepID=A0A2W7QSM6_9BACT|nr:CRISPR-associated helicase/endonuclease Cas3 [Algoriphagus ratkowskyi]PZX51583.1 CRISPR-associated endonuclease/helicase Cas3 [Algoriphagus ratkowskyi]TXD78857.1 CRISPR-associated helicase/endonuclease Cas3 [Algoriphagus ratkowskyi]
MIPLTEILAKSKNYGGLTLLEHTQQVTEAIELFATKYSFNFNIDVARRGAILHDLGKAHPYFQRKIKDINSGSLSEIREWNFVHRHEISSLAFLPCFPKEEWNSLIDLVIGHHKSIENDPSGRGIIDLVENDRMLIDNHLKDWNDWKGYGFEILNLFKIKTKDISYEEAKSALDYVIGFCERKNNGYSPLRGLLKSADHFASAFTHNTSSHLKYLFETPDLSFFRDEERKSDLYPLSQISTDDSRKHTLVVASTGAGKTDFLLRRSEGRVFYTLPYQASINSMWERIKSVVPNKDIRLLHATSRIVTKNNIDEQILQPLAGSAVKILTPHQLASIIFGTSGFETVMLDLHGTDVILDEIHTYSDFSRSMVLEIVKALIRLDCRIHIGTATMPTVLYNELLNMLGGKEQVYEVSLAKEILDTFDRHRIDKLEDESMIEGILRDAFANNEKVLVIFNTIKKAQDFYKKIEEEEDFRFISKMLIHSRFKRGDRVELETKLKSEFNGDGSELFGNGLMPCMVVSTQVVEVSLDISFDRMITQCAPLDGMIQRFGRVNRKRTIDTIGKFKPVHVIKPSGSVLPYKMEILKASFDQLPSEFEVLKERSLQEKIDVVYPILESKEIDVHLIYKNDRYQIKELTNNKKAVLVDALEIESSTCILETDRGKYLDGNWEERLQMEIPINYRTISRHESKFEQLEVGSYPFVIPQQEFEYQKYGLQLVEHDNFI